MKEHKTSTASKKTVILHTFWKAKPMQKTTQLDSPTFATMLRQGAVQLGRDKKLVNDLNVFPIPDGDTGDNMLMTLKAGCNALKDNMGPLSELASAAS